MNNLEEIKFQNKFDYFAKMYGFIARSMMEMCIRDRRRGGV